MRSEREDNPVTLSTAPMNKLKKTSMPESDPGTKRIWQGETSNHSLEEGEIPNQTTTVRIELYFTVVTPFYIYRENPTTCVICVVFHVSNRIEFLTYRP